VLGRQLSLAWSQPTPHYPAKAANEVRPATAGGADVILEAAHGEANHCQSAPSSKVKLETNNVKWAHRRLTDTNRESAERPQARRETGEYRE
jgi:hypothetical protein